MQLPEQKTQLSEQEAQQKQAEAEVQVELQRMLVEVRKKLKGQSKNELIRIIGALLLDNYSLKMLAAQAKQEKVEVKNEQ